MSQDTDFRRDVLAGVTQQAEAENVKVVATTARKPTDTDFASAVTRLREARCDLIAVGRCPRHHNCRVNNQENRMNSDLHGQATSYDTAVATAPGRIGGHPFHDAKTLCLSRQSKA
jgi:branched-chain amino acid transport system substrate-binding protein